MAVQARGDYVTIYVFDCLENGCVVTTEKHTPNAAKIPNVCEYFHVEWTDLEGFMESEQWRF